MALQGDSLFFIMTNLSQWFDQITKRIRVLLQSGQQKTRSQKRKSVVSPSNPLIELNAKDLKDSGQFSISYQRFPSAIQLNVLGPQIPNSNSNLTS